jgi:hypothetical protein
MSRTALIRAAAAAALAATAGLITATHGDVGADGLWVLQVVARLQAGDVLYRDIFAGVPPLAFFAARAATSAWGLELVALRIALVGVLALSYVVSADLLRRITGTHRYDVALAGMFALWALPSIASLYQPLANLCLLASLDAVAWWSDGPGRRGALRALPLWLAGAAAGLSFLAKQTVGAYAIVAAVAAIAATHARHRSALTRWAADVSIAAAGFGLTVAAGLAPVVAGGAWRPFLDYAFLNKGTYLSVAGLSYVGELAEYFELLRPAAAFDHDNVVKQQPILLPLLLLPALAVLARARRRIDVGMTLVAGLALAEAVSLFPRPDLEHVVSAAPGMLVVALAAWHAGGSGLTAAWRTAVEAVCILAVIAGLSVRLGASASALASDDRAWSDLPHLKHVLMYRSRAAQLAAHARALRTAAPSGRLLLLVPDASLYYLVSGLVNPTPFDYPLVTAFGRTGETGLVRSIEDGRLRQVCMRPVAGPMAPAILQQAVLARLQVTADLGACVLYNTRP